MHIVVVPGGRIEGDTSVPGDKSIAHRWLILAATARGASRLVGLPPSLDVRSTASCLAALTGTARPALEAWARNGPASAEGHGSTWNDEDVVPNSAALEVEAEGRSALVEPPHALDCGNSGTAMRLLAGVVAGSPFRTLLVGDASLSTRPMDRVAEPLREMGAEVETTDGHPPVTVVGGSLRGVRYDATAPSAQVKSAILLAGLAANGPTTVVEPVQTRDHTERALGTLGVTVVREGPSVTIDPFQHRGFEGAVPGDPSSAAFLVAAAAVTGSGVAIHGVGLNPTRIAFLKVLGRMGVRSSTQVVREELGEPVGDLIVEPGDRLVGTRVGAGELPSVIDEIPALAAVAAAARGESRFEGAAELRLKESDRLGGIARGLVGLGGHAGVEGEDLVVAGSGLRGGRAGSLGDHRLAMAFAVAALAAEGPSRIMGAEAAAVSYPGFFQQLAAIGAVLEVHP